MNSDKSEYFPPPRYALVVAPLALYSAVAICPSLRDTLPEPWDIADHIGNVMLTAPIAGLAAVHAMGPTTVASLEAYSEVKARSKAAIVGAAAGMVLNSLIDYKTGISVLDAFMIPNFTDFVYGVVTGPLAGALMPRTSKEASAALDRLS